VRKKTITIILAVIFLSVVIPMIYNGNQWIQGKKRIVADITSLGKQWEEQGCEKSHRCNAEMAILYRSHDEMQITTWAILTVGEGMAALFVFASLLFLHRKP
jgi:hypothetical protein